MTTKTPPSSFWNTGQSFLLFAGPEQWSDLKQAAISHFSVSHFEIVTIGSSGNVGIEEARELVHESQHMPTQGSARLSIIEYADRCTDEAANALLKILEEPPLYTRIILLAATHRILATIQSRCISWTSPDSAPAEKKSFLPLEKASDFATVSLHLADVIGQGLVLSLIDSWTAEMLQQKEPRTDVLHWLIEARELASTSAINIQALLEVIYLSAVYNYPLPTTIEKALRKHHGHL